MKTITKADLPGLRRTLALTSHPEELVSQKWDDVAHSMGMVSLSETVKGLKIILFLCAKATVVLVGEVALRGTESTMHGLDTLNKIKSEASELLAALEN